VGKARQTVCCYRARWLWQGKYEIGVSQDFGLKHDKKTETILTPMKQRQNYKFDQKLIFSNA
jgi:hypothetical protein